MHSSNLIQSIPIISEPVVDLWECLPRDWPRRKYDTLLVDKIDILFKQFFKNHNIKTKRILDCGCGTGNPSIGLAKKGYDVFCIDADANMVNRFKDNCSEEKINIPIFTSDWRDLNGEMIKKDPFDAAICRGNSLIYASCWDRDSFIPEASEKAIINSLKHIASVIKLGGLFYVDITSRKEYKDNFSKFEYVGERETEEHFVTIYWINTYDSKERTRKVHARRIFESKTNRQIQQINEYVFTSYMLYHEELKKFCNIAGFELLEEYYHIPEEWLYDVFLFKRKG